MGCVELLRCPRFGIWVYQKHKLPDHVFCV
jgi:hypothetical protein